MLLSNFTLTKKKIWPSSFYKISRQYRNKIKDGMGKKGRGGRGISR
jgi:hypothetical protein